MKYCIKTCVPSHTIHFDTQHQTKVIRITLTPHTHKTNTIVCVLAFFIKFVIISNISWSFELYKPSDTVEPHYFELKTLNCFL